MGHFFEGMIYNISLFSRLAIFFFFDHILAAIVHKTFVTTAHPPTAKGGDLGISAFSALAHTEGKLGGQNFALWSHRRNRKLPWSKDPNA